MFNPLSHVCVCYNTYLLMAWVCLRTSVGKAVENASAIIAITRSISCFMIITVLQFQRCTNNHIDSEDKVTDYTNHDCYHTPYLTPLIRIQFHSSLITNINTYFSYVNVIVF